MVEVVHKVIAVTLASTLSLMASCGDPKAIDRAEDTNNTQPPTSIEGNNDGITEGVFPSTTVLGYGEPDANDNLRTLLARSEAVVSLTELGLSEFEAGCVYDTMNENPNIVEDFAVISPQLETLRSSVSEGAQQLPEESVPTLRRIVDGVSPCLNSETVSELSAVLSGLGNATETDTRGTSTFASFVDSLPRTASGTVDIAALAKVDPQKLSEIDLGSADGTEQLLLLGNSITEQLTPEQIEILQSITKVDLSGIQLAINAAILDPRQLGSLVELLEPVISATVTAVPQLPGPDDPPPAIDFSAVNPLQFIPLTVVSDRAAERGIPRAVTECVYNELKKLDASSITALFSETPTNLATSSVTLASLACVIGS